MLEQTLTRHAESRMNQRGFRPQDVKLVMETATQVDANGYLLTKADAQRAIENLKKRIQMIERLKGCKIILGGDKVVTIYHATNKNQKRSLRQK